MLNLPVLTGSQWLSLILVLSLAGMGGGLALLARQNLPLTGRPQERFYALIALAIIVTAAIVCGLLGWWVLGGILLIICVLLMGVMLYLLA